MGGYFPGVERRRQQLRLQSAGGGGGGGEGGRGGMSGRRERDRTQREREREAAYPTVARAGKGRLGQSERASKSPAVDLIE